MTTPVTDPAQNQEPKNEAPTTSSTPTVNQFGFPDNTPWREMAPEYQVNYWQHQSRGWENKVKGMSDYEANKEKASQFDALSAASKTDAEKAIDAAKSETRAQVLREVGGRLVDAEFTALTAGRMTDKVRAAHMIGLNREAFLAADGSVNKEALTTYVDGIAPAKVDEKSTTPVDLGQGKRGTKSSGSLENGAAIFAQMYGKK